jgi:hypothetical protein
MKAIHQLCGVAVNQDCSKDAHKEVGLNIDDTLKCVMGSFNEPITQSFYNNESVVNKLIEEQLMEQRANKILLTPTLKINN